MSLNPEKRKLLEKFINNQCEQCKLKFPALEAHRIKRGNMGGKYELRNIKMICNKCHKLIHHNEPGTNIK